MAIETKQLTEKEDAALRLKADALYSKNFYMSHEGNETEHETGQRKKYIDKFVADTAEHGNQGYISFVESDHARHLERQAKGTGEREPGK
jgi:hypothetical protein